MAKSNLDQGAELYDPLEGESVEEAVQSTILSDKAQLARFHHLIGHIPTQAQSLLDVGAGYGVFLDELRKLRGITTVGVDIAEKNMQWGLERGLDLRAASAHQLPFDDRSFDIVVSSECVEHLRFGVYEQALKEIARVAHRWALISVPYDEKRDFATCPYCQSKINPSHHLRSFTPETMDGLLEGFQLIETSTVGTVPKVTMLKPYLPTQWHPRMVCSACGYHKPFIRSTGALDRNSLIGKAKRWVKSLPLPTRPRWLVGVYQRV